MKEKEERKVWSEEDEVASERREEVLIETLIRADEILCGQNSKVSFL